MIKTVEGSIKLTLNVEIDMSELAAMEPEARRKFLDFVADTAGTSLPQVFQLAEAAATAQIAGPDEDDAPEDNPVGLTREDIQEKTEFLREQERKRPKMECRQCGFHPASREHKERCRKQPAPAPRDPDDDDAPTFVSRVETPRPAPPKPTGSENVCKTCGNKYWAREHLDNCGRKHARANAIDTPFPSKAPKAAKPPDAPSRSRAPSHGNKSLDSKTAPIPDYSEYGKARPLPRDWTTRNEDGERIIREPLTSANRHFHVWKAPQLNPDLDVQLARCACGDAIPIKNFDKTDNWHNWEEDDGDEGLVQQPEAAHA